MMNSNSELTPPIWLNNVFLEKALKSGENDPNIQVIHSNIKQGTAPGDNYGSDMYRAIVQITRGAETEKKSLIIKITRSGLTGEAAEFFANSPIFEREINTFAIAHPAMYDILDKFSIGSNQPFAATHIYSQNEYSKRAIVLQDLKEQGFRLAERTLGLDLKHCLLVMRTIARYHAASVALHQKDPNIISLFKDKLFKDDDDSKLMETFFAGNVRNCAKEVSTWPGYKERYADKLHKLVDTATGEWMRALNQDEGPFNVLIHGDLWANNMMFHYSEETGEVTDVRFVDFQLSSWATPAVDLQYFLNSSASPEVLENVEVLIEEYHNTLCKTLAVLGYKHLQPTLEQLNEDIEKMSLFGVVSAITVRAVALADRSKVPDMNKVMADEEEVHLSETYKISIKKLLPIYGKRGWI